ncbi:MAG TPA: hypothetical protein VKS01_07605 [Bryobacteraceae bacterium]|nr:hypothetical protein [Bryobacteraceae bacterium]
MSIAKRLTLENVNSDDPRELDELDEQMFAAGLARVRKEGNELRHNGLMDADGNLTIRELPFDMREGSDLDFGG